MSVPIRREKAYDQFLLAQPSPASSSTASALAPHSNSVERAILRGSRLAASVPMLSIHSYRNATIRVPESDVALERCSAEWGTAVPKIPSKTESASRCDCTAALSGFLRSTIIWFWNVRCVGPQPKLR